MLRATRREPVEWSHDLQVVKVYIVIEKHLMALGASGGIKKEEFATVLTQTSGLGT